MSADEGQSFPQVSGGDRIEFSSMVKVSVRQYFATQHLWSARHFSRECARLESDLVEHWHPIQNLASSVIGGAIRDKWNTVGAETRPLGYPSSDEIPVTKNNGRYNNFVNGTITW